MRRIWLVALIALSFGVGFFLVLRAGAAPYRQFVDSSWLVREQMVPVPVDEYITRMIRAARRDHFIAPNPSVPRYLYFLRAASVEPNDVYLIFGFSGGQHAEVYYRCARENGRLLWKTTAGTY